VIEHKDLKVVVINSPHRYDLLPHSCLNLEVKKIEQETKQDNEITLRSETNGVRARQEPLYQAWTSS
jgi:hypothetical protein